MTSLKYFTIVVYLIIQMMSAQSASVSGNLNARYGNGIQFNNLNETNDFDYIELLADINIRWKSLSGWMQYEFSNPPEYGRSSDTIRRFRFNYSKNNLNIALGDIYRSWDRGLILSQFEDQQIDFDNSIRGAGFLLNTDIFEIDLIAGARKQYQSTPFNTNLRKQDESVHNSVLAGRLGFKIGQSLNGLSILAATTEFPLFSRGGVSDKKSNVTSILTGYSFEYNQMNWDVALDAVIKKSHIDPELYFTETNFTDFSIDSIPREKHIGYGIYGIINKYIDNWSLTLDYKKYNFSVMNPDRRISYPYPEGNIIYQNPPLTFYEHSSTLLNRNIHQLDKNDEIGYQLTVTGVIDNKTDVLLNFSKGSRNVTWKRNVGDFLWQKGPWQKTKTAILLPFDTPDSNPYSEMFGEITSYLFEDKILTKVGISKSSQSLILFENIQSTSNDSLSYEFVDALTIPFDISYAFSNGFSLEVKYQFQKLSKGIRSKVKSFGKSHSNDTSFFYEISEGSQQSKKYQNISIIQFGIQKSPSWGISFIIERDRYHEFGINSKILK